MSAFIGAALPWMGGKVSDLLGFAGRDSEDEGDDDENTTGDGSGGRSSGGEIIAAAAAASSEASNGSPQSPSSLSSKASAVPASSSPRGSRVPQGRGRSSRRRYSMVAGSGKGATKAAVTPAIRMCSPSKIVDKKTSSGSGKGESSLRNAPVRRVRNRAQGSPPSKAVAALSMGPGRGEDTGDAARRKPPDASAISGGSNGAKNSTISPRRRNTFDGETREEADWRVPCSRSPETANPPASMRRRSSSLSSGPTANSARAWKASTLLEVGHPPAVSRGGGRAGDDGKVSLVETSVDADVDNTLSVVADGGKKKRRADTAGLSGRRSGSDSGQAKRRTSSAAAAGKEDGKVGKEKSGKKSDSNVIEGGSGAVAFAVPRPEAMVVKATVAKERRRSASPTPASGRSQERTSVAGSRSSGGFSLRSRAELRKPAFLRGDMFSSSINNVESVHRPSQETPPRSGGCGRRGQNERLLARLPSPPQANEASASTNGFAKDGSFPSTHDHDHDDDGPRLGGYNGSLIANGGGGNAWRTPRVRRQEPSLPVNEGGGAVEDGVLVPRPFLWARNGAHVSPARGGNVVVTSGSDGVGSNIGSSVSTSDIGGFGCSSNGNNVASDASRCKAGCLQSAPTSASAAASAANVSPAAMAAAPAPVAPGRLAWCGDRRLLPRPSATLQLRRHVPSLSSPGAAQSAVTAAYLGRLDLIADSAEAESPRLRGVGGNGRHEGRSKNTDDVDGQIRSKKIQDRSACAAAGSDVPASPFNSSAGDGQGGISICKKNCWGEKVEAEAEDATAVTLSSSGVSATSGEDEEDSDSDEIFMMVIDDSDELDYYPSSSPSGVFEAGDCVSAGETCERAENGVQAVSKVSRKGCTVKRAGSLLDGEEPTVVAGKAAVAKAAKAAAFCRDEATTGRTPIASRGPLPRCRGSNSDAEEESRSAPPCCPGDARLVAAYSPFGLGTARGNRTQNAVRAPSCATDASAASRSDIECFTAEHRLLTSRARSRVRTSAGEASAGSGTSSRGPLVPPQPPVGPRKWPPRPPHRALVYAAAAEASRHARGFTGWSFPALPPPLPRPQMPKPVEIAPLPTVESETVENPPRVIDDRQGDKDEEETGKGARGRGRRGRNMVGREEEVFLGFARDNPPGKPSPNQFGWMALDPMHTAEGRAAVKKRALERKRRAIELAAKRKREELEDRRKELERIALQKRQEILDALRIKEEIAEERRKRKLNILFLGMTRVAEYDSRGGLAKGMKRFELVEKMVRHDVDETNMNPLRDTARVLAMEALGHEVRCISKVSTPGESDSESSRSTRAKGGPTGLGRFLATDMTNTGASRGFLRRIEEKWSTITFDTILLDHYWLPDSVVWLNKGYMANDGGLIQNLVKMTTTKLLRDDFEIMLPINQAFFELLLPHFRDLEKHFTVEFLVGERLEHLKRSHLALEADDLIPADVMLNTYGKEREHQVSQMLGVKQPTAEVAAILLKYGVAAQHFCYARFLKLSRNPPPHPALAAVALTAASAAAKIAEESARIAAERADLAAQSAKEMSEFDEKENRAAAADAVAALDESTETRASCGSVKDVSRRS